MPVVPLGYREYPPKKIESLAGQGPGFSCIGEGTSTNARRTAESLELFPGIFSVFRSQHAVFRCLSVRITASMPGVSMRYRDSPAVLLESLVGKISF
jgi:hypothetical protein